MWMFQFGICLCILNIVEFRKHNHLHHCKKHGHHNRCTTTSTQATKVSTTVSTTMTTLSTATTTTPSTTIRTDASTTILQTTNATPTTTVATTTTKTTATKTKTTITTPNVTLVLTSAQSQSISDSTIKPAINRQTYSAADSGFKGIIAGTVIAVFVLIAGGVLVAFLIRKRGCICFRSKHSASTSNYREHQDVIDSSVSGNAARNFEGQETNHNYTYIDTNTEHIVIENKNFSYELAKPINRDSDGNGTETKEATGQYFILEKQGRYDLSQTNGDTYTETLISEYDHLRGKNERQKNKTEQQNVYAHAVHTESVDKEYDVTSFKMSKDTIDSDMYDHTEVLGEKVSDNNDPYDHCSC